MGGEKDLLRGVLRVVRVAQEEPAEAINHPPVLLEQLGDTRAGRLGEEATGRAARWFSGSARRR